MKRANSQTAKRSPTRPLKRTPKRSRSPKPAAAILGVGIDHAVPKRIADAIRRGGRKFLERIYTAKEIAYCRRYRRRPEERFAARWAAKEAAAKALGVGIADGIRWTEFAIENAPNGAPTLTVTGHAAALARAAGVRRWLVSLTHTESLASAVVLALG